MKKLIILSMFFISISMFSQAKEQTFKERKEKQALTFREEFIQADLAFTQGKKYISFKKDYDKNIKIMQKHIDRFCKPKKILKLKL